MQSAHDRMQEQADINDVLHFNSSHVLCATCVHRLDSLNSALVVSKFATACVLCCALAQGC